MPTLAEGGRLATSQWLAVADPSLGVQGGTGSLCLVENEIGAKSLRINTSKMYQRGLNG